MFHTQCTIRLKIRCPFATWASGWSCFRIGKQEQEFWKVLSYFESLKQLRSSAFLPYFKCVFKKESACNAGDPGPVPGSGRSAGAGVGYPLQCSWASLVAQLVKNPPAMCGRPGFDSWVGKIPW